ncbi:ATP-binding protein involved in chromosome partitioning [Rhodoligotrophos appendicifer]|uniref:iron-sulfur cluster carrier protein ApbC n=1 Tax=Rhodoligotrophos appendicifer TaxID=987056 RepID=UPI0011864549|nr:iron-sulfur cluster carrier protein ApbC [Rhodoligotrophos appendicifer]
MTDVTKEDVLSQLAKVRGPDLEGNIVAMGLVSEIMIREGTVTFAVMIDPARAEELEGLRQAAERAVGQLDGVKRVIVALTADTVAAGPRAPTAATASAQSGTRARTISPPGQASPPAAPRPAPALRQGGPVPGIRHIIAVASGKGGVGKSTTAVNLALALQAQGLKVGVLDADVYGPSMPRLLGLKGKPQTAGGRNLIPLEAYGLKVMSMGFLVDEETAMIWRGPMVMSALTQLLREVVWGELDVLVVDMPPGTGDAQLTMAQQVPLSGAVIVSTPQDLALIDARKGLSMFRKVDVPVLGIIENMSYFICPSCGERSEIFGHGGARHEAERLDLPFLGEVPLDIAMRERSDAGTPILATDPGSIHTRIFLEMADKVWRQIAGSGASAQRPPPRIVLE